MDGMNPSSNDVPGINLPQPAPPAAQTPVPLADDTSTTRPAKTPIRDDSDTIEKEWVGRVKDIVGRTRNDPHEQSRQLTALKAEYMKQRYNKIIKVDT